MPYWKTIRDELKRRISAGEYDGKLLVEIRLAQEFETTRITVRKALRALREEGLIETEVGIGSRVVTDQEQKPQ